MICLIFMALRAIYILFEIPLFFDSPCSSRRFEISLFIPEAAALHCTGAIVSRAFNLISCHTIHIHHPHLQVIFIKSLLNPDIQIWSRYSPYANVGNCFSEDSLNYQGHSGTSTLPPSQYTTADLHTT